MRCSARLVVLALPQNGTVYCEEARVHTLAPFNLRRLGQHVRKIGETREVGSLACIVATLDHTRPPSRIV